jgi:hypothetical protein
MVDMYEGEVSVMNAIARLVGFRIVIWVAKYANHVFELNAGVLVAPPSQAERMRKLDAS